MEKTADLKKQLTIKGNAVKRTVKEYLYQCKDTQKEQAKLKKMQDEGKEEGDIKRQTDYVGECEGAKKQSYQSVEKFYGELNELLTKIDTHVDDEEQQKARDEAKALPEYTKAKEYLQSAKDVIDKDGAAK